MVSGSLAGTVADHLELDGEAVRDADGLDVERLLPLLAVFRALFQCDLGCELDYVADL